MHLDYFHNSDIEYFSIFLSNKEIMNVPIDAIKSFNAYGENSIKDNNEFCYADIHLVLDENFDYLPFNNPVKESVPAYFRLSYKDIKSIKVSYENNKSKIIVPINHLHSEIRDGKFYLTTIKED